ncbi:hypothetical protein EVA_03779 [gut metagenome]|uniref:Uncharacterized protein n=1 Tax=gut metagenome TaxID=749906 RepID=J9GL50_9ZZZZ
MKHIKTNLENNKATGYTKAVSRNAKKLKKELPGKGKHHNGNKSHPSGASYHRTAFFLRHSLRHGQKHRHGTQRISQSKERSKTKQSKWYQSFHDIVNLNRKQITEATHTKRKQMYTFNSIFSQEC